MRLGSVTGKTCGEASMHCKGKAEAWEACDHISEHTSADADILDADKECAENWDASLISWVRAVCQSLAPDLHNYNKLHYACCRLSTAVYMQRPKSKGSTDIMMMSETDAVTMSSDPLVQWSLHTSIAMSSCCGTSNEACYSCANQVQVIGRQLLPN